MRRFLLKIALVASFSVLIEWTASIMARANLTKIGRFALRIDSRVSTAFHQKGILSEPMSSRSLNPSFSASRTKGSGMMENWITPFASAAKRSALPPAVMILASFSGSTPTFLSASLRPRSEVLPRRFTPPILPLSSSRDMTDDRGPQPKNHPDIRAGEPRGGEGRHRSDDDIDFAREHRLERRRARTDTDYFAVEAMLREQPFFLHYPDRAVRRAVAGPRDADALLCRRRPANEHESDRGGDGGRNPQ